MLIDRLASLDQARQVASQLERTSITRTKMPSGQAGRAELHVIAKANEPGVEQILIVVSICISAGINYTLRVCLISKRPATVGCCIRFIKSLTPTEPCWLYQQNHP